MAPALSYATCLCLFAPNSPGSLQSHRRPLFLHKTLAVDSQPCCVLHSNKLSACPGGGGGGRNLNDSRHATKPGLLIFHLKPWVLLETSLLYKRLREVGGAVRGLCTAQCCPMRAERLFPRRGHRTGTHPGDSGLPAGLVLVGQGCQPSSRFQVAFWVDSDATGRICGRGWAFGSVQDKLTGFSGGSVSRPDAA